MVVQIKTTQLVLNSTCAVCPVRAPNSSWQLDSRLSFVDTMELLLSEHCPAAIKLVARAVAVY